MSARTILVIIAAVLELAAVIAGPYRGELTSLGLCLFMVSSLV